MAAAPTPMPTSAGPQQGGAPGGASQPQSPQSQQPQQPDQGRERTMKFVQLAQAVQQLAQEVPEGTEEASAILPLIQKWMTKAAGNPQRTPEQQAPPSA